MVSASQPFSSYVVLPAWPGPLPLLSRGGGGCIKVHPTGFTVGQVQISGGGTCCGQDKGPIQEHAMGKAKDLYSACCPTGGCA